MHKEIIKMLNGGETEKKSGFSSIPTESPWSLKGRKFTPQDLGNLASFGSNLLGTNRAYEGKYGTTTLTIDGLSDTAADTLGQFNPALGAFAKAGLFAGKLMGKLGGSTDGMTKADSILSSSLGQLTGIGFVNGALGKKSDVFNLDKYTASQSQFSYGGTNYGFNDALSKSGKKYGMFSSRARKKANAQIAAAGRTLNNLKYLIKDRDMAMESMGNTTDIYNTGYANELMGGYAPIYAAKKGTKLPTRKLLARAKRLSSDVKRKEYLKKLANEQVDAYKSGGTFEFDISMFLKGGKSRKHWQKPPNWTEEKIPYEEWIKELHPDEYNGNYDLKTAYEYFPKEDLERWKFAATQSNLDDKDYYMNYQDLSGRYIYHLGSIAPIPNSDDFIFLKKGKEDTNPELHFETDGYWNGENGLKDTHDLVFENDRYYYRKKKSVESHKKGGKLDSKPNIIPEGALHARRHHLEDINPELKGEITTHGVPVISEEDGGIVLHAEIELNEIIFQKSVTEEFEKLYNQYKSTEDSKEKDEIAIKCGKLISKLIMENTIDKTGVLNEEVNP